MTSPRNNVRVLERLCSSHSQACNYLLMQNCRMKKICNRCLEIYSPVGPQVAVKIMNTDAFKDYISGIVSKQELKIQRSSIIDIRKIFQEKKKEIQQKQHLLLDRLINRINRDKQNLLAELDELERTYLTQQNRYISHIQQKDQIIRYLKQFCIDEQLLKLKITISNQYGLSSFLSQIKSLQILGQQYTYRNTTAITNQLYKQISSRQENTFSWKLQRSLKDRVEQKQRVVNAIPLIKIPTGKSKIAPKQSTQRRNQSQQNIIIKSPRTSRVNSFAQLPKIPII